MTNKPQVPPPCDLTLGMTCINKSIAGKSTWKMRVTERFLNPVGIMQGGFVAAFVDSAMGASAITFARSINPDMKLKAANAEMKISLLKPIYPDTEIICDAEVISGGKTIIFVEAKVKSAENKLLATANSTYVVLNR